MMRHPEKSYGKVEPSDIAPTLLATDYKSPSLCIEIYEEDNDTEKGTE